MTADPNSFANQDVDPNLEAAFFSPHAGHPVLAFLLLRRSFGQRAWLVPRLRARSALGG